MQSILLVFIDGIGLGTNTDINPFWNLELPAFERLSGGQKWTSSAVPILTDNGVFRGVDARLNVPGLPQSGTGQATLFTGVNCAKLADRHYGPFPHSKTRAAIREFNIFSRINRAGKSSTFANAYPPIFFDKAKTRDRWSVTTRACLDSSVHIRTLEDLQSGSAVSADLTRLGLQKYLDIDIETIDEREAADHLSELATNHDFTAFEYFLTDRAGHRMSHELAQQRLTSLDRFLSRLSVRITENGDTLIVTSDHGNLEDLSVRTHTTNEVPLAVQGPHAEYFKSSSSLTDIVPAIMTALQA